MFRYFAAQVYDFLILIALFFAFTAFCLIGTQGQAISPGTHSYQSALLGLTFAYYAISLRYCGQTIGMRAWRLQLISETDVLGFKQVVKRLLLLLPATVFAVLFGKHPQYLLSCWTKTRILKY
ncbi:RDD family protein [Legionella jordanis]|uniref:RDD family protein n=1 Tax=Legionella jordanis TaxID=456 RepID=A0A0W0VEU9_9GAMM|nr:RDD family protein [Legionella jordanis]KTD18169.1 RDD family protein [Legionella jordanis]RMX01131.1 RDD family protein [Legionella jordanis]RMX21361.1 RDD family protein [Legionella jordanis]VEH13738.1 RDD family [Legionella jordanis]HAT8714551.1 RDD family protein [Legionella jordanis]